MTVRLKYIARPVRRMVDPSTWPQSEVAHYSIPNLDAGGAAIEDTREIGSAKLAVRQDDSLVSKLNPHKPRVFEVTHRAALASSEFIVLRDPIIDARFLRYFLSSDPAVHHLVARMRSVTRSHQRATEADVGDLPMPAVDHETSARIADFLDRETQRIDALVDAKRRMIDLLKEKRATTIAVAMSNAADSVFMRLKHLLREPLAYGANESASQYVEGDPRYIRTTDIDGRGLLRDDDSKTLSWDLARPYMLQDGDILLTRSGATVGKSLLYTIDLGPACHAGYLVRVRPNRRIVSPRYLRYFTDSASYWRQVAEGSIQATIQNVSAARYAEFLIPVPPRQAQDQIVSQLDSQIGAIDLTINRLTRQLDFLAEYRQALITQAVTGQLDVATLKGKRPADEVVGV